jgi:hypothetical protein
MSHSPNRDCIVCYKDTLFSAPCCKQPFCEDCAANWAEKNHTPTCPGCRKPYYTSLDQCEGSEIFLKFKKNSKINVIAGTLVALCPKIIKFKTHKTHSNQMLHIKYRNITEYKPACAPNAFTCERKECEFKLVRATYAEIDESDDESDDEAFEYLTLLMYESDDAEHRYDQACTIYANDLCAAAEITQNIYISQYMMKGWLEFISSTDYTIEIIINEHALKKAFEFDLLTMPVDAHNVRGMYRTICSDLINAYALKKSKLDNFVRESRQYFGEDD